MGLIAANGPEWTEKNNKPGLVYQTHGVHEKVHVFVFCNFVPQLLREVATSLKDRLTNLSPSLTILVITRTLTIALTIIITRSDARVIRSLPPRATFVHGGPARRRGRNSKLCFLEFIPPIHRIYMQSFIDVGPSRSLKMLHTAQTDGRSDI